MIWHKYVYIQLKSDYFWGGGARERERENSSRGPQPAQSRPWSHNPDVMTWAQTKIWMLQW